MPPAGFLSRKPWIGEPSPSTPSSSILVFGSSMNTVCTPCSGWSSTAETAAPSTSRYWRAAASMSGTAIATWLRRPIIRHWLVPRPLPSASNAASESAPRRVTCTSTIGRRCRGRSSAWRTAPRAASRTRSSSAAAVVQLLDRVGDRLGDVAPAARRSARARTRPGPSAAASPARCPGRRARGRPGSCRGSSAGGGCGTCRRRRRRSPSVSTTTMRPTGTSSITSGVLGGEPQHVAVLDQHERAARPSARPGAGGRAGGGPRRGPAPRSSA